MMIDFVISYINLVKVISFCHHDNVRPSHDRATSAWSIYIYWWKHWHVSGTYTRNVSQPDMKKSNISNWIPQNNAIKKSLGHWFIEEAV